MSQPPPAIYDLPQLPTPRRQGSIGTWIAWILIILTVGFAMVSAIIPSIRGRAPVEESTDDPQLTILAKYVVGLHSISKTGSDALLPQVDQTAKSPVQKLHAAILAGELSGKDAAISRLNSIEPLPPSLKPDIDSFRTVYVDGPDALDPETRTKLMDRHGYFGKLALTFGKPPSDPEKQPLISQGQRTAIALFSFLVLIGLGTASGVILLTIGLVLLARKVILLAYRPPASLTGIYVEMFAVYLVSFFAGSILLGLILGKSFSLSWSWLLTITVPLAFAWGMLRGLRWSDIRQAIGWTLGKGPHIEIPLGIVGYIAGLPVVLIGFGITYILILLTGVTPSHPVQGAETGTGLDILMLYGIACIWAPVIEETMFRGALYSHLRAHLGWIGSGWIVGVIFAAIHPQGWTFIPVLASIGFVLASLREWRGSLLAPITAHALNNFVMISLMMLVK